MKKRKNAVTLKISYEEVSHVLFKEITKLGMLKVRSGRAYTK